MKTGRFRVRRGLFGTGVLQQEFDVPSLIGGQIDASVRELIWLDVKFEKCSHVIFLSAEAEKEGK